MINKEKCCACGACIAVCPKKAISFDETTLCKIPIVDKEKCINCSICEKVCGNSNKFNKENTPKFFAAYNKDLYTRCTSTSGGVFSAFAEKTIDNGGYVCGVYFDGKFNLSYHLISNKQDLQKCKKSKYVQAETGDIFIQVKNKLEENKEVLFVGLPCQVYGLKLFLKKEYDNLITVDLLCHGVISNKIFKDYINYQEKKLGKKITDFVFRARDEHKGWHRPCYCVTYENGSEEKLNLSRDYYFGLFGKNIAVQDACFECQFRSMSRVGDISLGDFWCIKKIAPSLDSNDGISLVFVNNEKGMKTLENTKNSLLLKEINDSYEIIKNSTKALTGNIKEYKFRKAFIKRYEKKGFKNACFWHVTIYRILSHIPLIRKIYK